MEFKANSYLQIDTSTEFYSDFFTNFDIHPHKHDLARNTNETAVITSIKNLIFTNKYERLFNPGIGSKIRTLLFEPVDTKTQVSLQDEIKETITNYEPRAKIVDVIVTPFIDEAAYAITITFYIINNTAPITLQTTLFRVR